MGWMGEGEHPSKFPVNKSKTHYAMHPCQLMRIFDRITSKDESPKALINYGEILIVR